MIKFKCDVCKCNPEELWMFSGFGIFPKDDKEYCESCFKERVEFFQSHRQEEAIELEQKETEHNLIA
jgi:hypothetical protein